MDSAGDSTNPGHVSFVACKPTAPQVKKLVDSAVAHTGLTLVVGGGNGGAKLSLAERLREAETRVTALAGSANGNTQPVRAPLDVACKRKFLKASYGTRPKRRAIGEHLGDDFIATVDQSARSHYMIATSRELQPCGKELIEELRMVDGSQKAYRQSLRIGWHKQHQSGDYLIAATKWQCQVCGKIVMNKSGDASALGKLKAAHVKAHPVELAAGAFRTQPLNLMEIIEDPSEATWRCPVKDCPWGLRCYPGGQQARLQRMRHHAEFHPTAKWELFKVNSFMKTLNKFHVSASDLIMARSKHEVEIWMLPLVGIDKSRQVLATTTTCVLCSRCGRVGHFEKDRRQTVSAWFFSNRDTQYVRRGKKVCKFALHLDCEINRHPQAQIGVIGRYDLIIKQVDNCVVQYYGGVEQRAGKARLKQFVSRIRKLRRFILRQFKLMIRDGITRKAFAQPVVKIVTADNLSRLITPDALSSAAIRSLVGDGDDNEEGFAALNDADIASLHNLVC
jgi:hypothetical protein